MKKIWLKSLTILILLTMAMVSVGSANDIGPIEPLNPVPIDETGEMIDETPDLWFVEFRSMPIAVGGNIKNTRADKTKFKTAAEKIGLEYIERFAFDTLWNGVSISVKQVDVPKLSAIPGVKAVYPVERIPIPETTPDQTTPELFTALAMTGADVAQSELGYTGEGINVAVMDTGIDYDHPDLGGCFGPGCRVFTGWDFVGDDFTGDNTPQPDPYPDDCQGHGTHVSGIVGANGTITGVAPDVSFGAYRVFGCEGFTTADIMIAAMEMALKDDMDILNMSIGSAFQWPQYPTAVAADNLVQKGMVVVASIGNSGVSGLYSAGAPGLGEKVIGVASYDNTHARLPYFTVEDQAIGYITMGESPDPPTTGTEEIVFIGRACDVDLPLLDDPSGKVALAERGACSFAEKYLNAVEVGATAVVIHNSSPGIFAGTLGEPLDFDAPAVGISQEDGLFIRAQVAPVMMTWTDQFDLFPSPTGGLISAFSSYGLSPDLALKPDIGAPGGSIYSTYPLEKDGYAVLSGTSMSSPHVAGAAALLLQAKPKLKAEDVRDILQNSADPKLWWGNPGLGFLDNVHRQGAGMLDIDDAILATTIVTPAKIALGESETGPFTQKLTIKNESKRGVAYDLSYINALSTSGVIDPGFYLSNASVNFDSDFVSLKPGQTANVTVTITPDTVLEGLYGQYGGYIVLTPRNNGPIVRVPFGGFTGDYQEIQAITDMGYDFPWLAILYEDNYYRNDGSWVYTMQGDNIPFLLVHFDHQMELFRVEIIDAITGKLIHPIFNTAFYETFLPRNATPTGFFAFAWDGSRMHRDGPLGKTSMVFEPVPNGQYQLMIKALKANGDPNNMDHWETWTSPIFTITRP